MTPYYTSWEPTSCIGLTNLQNWKRHLSFTRETEPFIASSCDDFIMCAMTLPNMLPLIPWTMQLLRHQTLAVNVYKVEKFPHTNKLLDGTRYALIYTLLHVMPFYSGSTVVVLKPRHGHMMQSFTARFKQALRRCKAEQSKHVSDSLATKLLYHDRKSFWKKVKWINQ